MVGVSLGGMTTLAQTIKDQAAKVVTLTHRTVFDVTSGRVLGSIAGMPAVKLTTTGRKSGATRTVMLTVPVRTDDDEIVLVASYGGDDRYPAWYHNLGANPEVEVVTLGEKYTAIARTATDDEKASLWPKVTASYKGYAGYQTKTDRQIPLVICTRKA